MRYRRDICERGEDLLRLHPTEGHHRTEGAMCVSIQRNGNGNFPYADNCLRPKIFHAAQRGDQIFELLGYKLHHGP